MNQQVRTMLDNTYNFFKEKYKDPLKAWDLFIEFLALDNNGLLIRQLDNIFDEIIKGNIATDDVNKVYKAEFLRSDYYDHLGEMYFDKIMLKRQERQDKGIFKQKDLSDLLPESAPIGSKKLLKILDLKAGTGRLLMSVYKKYPNSILFGVDSDQRLIRIAMTNFAIHNIPGYLLTADRRIHDIDISHENGKYNWRYANKWHSNFNSLKPIDKTRDYCIDLKPVP